MSQPIAIEQACKITKQNSERSTIIQNAPVRRMPNPTTKHAKTATNLFNNDQFFQTMIAPRCNMHVMPASKRKQGCTKAVNTKSYHRNQELGSE
jgi:hypothetical protein